MHGVYGITRRRTVGMLFGLTLAAIAAIVALVIPGTARAAGDPVVGYWKNTAGVVNRITLSGSTYTQTNIVPVHVGSSTCTVPAGSVWETFQSTGPGTYSGNAALYYVSNCKFAEWTPVTVTLSADGRTLTEQTASGYGTWTEQASPPPSIAFDSKTVVVHSGHSAAVRLHCLNATCQGRITLTGSVVGHVRKRGHLVAVTHTVVLGQRTYALGANGHAAITLVLSASGRNFMRGASTRHPKHIRITVTVQGGAASSVAATAV